MDKEIFEHVKYWGSQIFLTILSDVANVPWLSILTFIGGCITIGFTVYKWRQSIKFNDIEFKIKQQQLENLKK